MQSLLLIDGNAIMHRAYHALPPFRSKDKTPTNVIYGFLSMLNKVITDFKPTHIASVFDTPEPTFRNEIFADYQSQRPKIEDDFIIQIPLVKQALDEANIFRIEKDGFEADDLIGTISKIFQSNNYRIIIVTGDKDIFQLINANVFVASPQLGLANIKIFNKTEVEQKLGIPPDKIVDYKALVGDPSDNYPGAKGIGPKTATNLIHRYGSVEKIYENLDNIQSEKIKAILINEEKSVILSKKLATILTDVVIDLDIKKLIFNGFNKRLKTFLEKYQMNSLVNRMFNEKVNIVKNIKKESQMGLF